jgi:hypothetical protein
LDFLEDVLAKFFVSLEEIIMGKGSDKTISLEMPSALSNICPTSLIVGSTLYYLD